MTLIVQKFGGTSVSTPERRFQVMEKVIKEKAAGNDVVVVVSAMGRRGDPYATDTFLDMLKEVYPKASKRTKDLLASCGEVISACILAESLVARGYPACPLTGFQAGITTDDAFTNGIVESVDASRLRAVLAQGAVAVVAGFQGLNPEKDIVTLGRGGSDTTAIALGGALEADEVIIFTDVPGIAYTDPRIIPSAPFLSSVDFEPIHILSQVGARVIHHRAVETAIKFNRPFWVRSTFNDDPGTLVGKKGEAPGGLYGIALLKDVLLATRDQDSAGEMRRLSCNQWFYRRHPLRTAVILEKSREEEAPAGCRVQEVSVITLQRDPAAGINPVTVAEAFDSAHIDRKAYFEVGDGGAWAVEPGRAKDAILALYRAPLQKI